MEVDKNKVGNAFNKAAGTYDSVASVQLECAQYLVKLIQNQDLNIQIKNILDIGTGTGFVVSELEQYYTDANYDLNDLSKNMLDIAKSKLNAKNISLINSDMDNLKLDKNYDLITSNLAIQWSDDIYKLISRLSEGSKILGCTTLFADTFKEWGDIFKKLNIKSPLYNYPAVYDFESKLRKEVNKKISLEVKNYKIKFNSVPAFMQYLKNLGANHGLKNVSHVDKKKLIEYKVDRLELTYQVGFIIVA